MTYQKVVVPSASHVLLVKLLWNRSALGSSTSNTFRRQWNNAGRPVNMIVSTEYVRGIHDRCSVFRDFTALSVTTSKRTAPKTSSEVVYKSLDRRDGLGYLDSAAKSRVSFQRLNDRLVVIYHQQRRSDSNCTTNVNQYGPIIIIEQLMVLMVLQAVQAECKTFFNCRAIAMLLMTAIAP